MKFSNIRFLLLFFPVFVQSSQRACLKSTECRINPKNGVLCWTKMYEQEKLLKKRRQEAQLKQKYTYGYHPKSYTGNTIDNTPKPPLSAGQEFYLKLVNKDL